jgi:hypothetical protein
MVSLLPFCSDIFYNCFDQLTGNPSGSGKVILADKMLFDLLVLIFIYNMNWLPMIIGLFDKGKALAERLKG